MRIVLFICLLMFSATSAQAGRCYAPGEAEAEQGIRIHSELMVIGLNCQHMGKRVGMNLYGEYRQFTARHADLFAEYEDRMRSYFKKTGVSAPEASLNTLRTGFANKISNDAANMRPDLFCATFAPRMEAVVSMNDQQLRQWAATVYPSHPVSQPLCEG